MKKLSTLLVASILTFGLSGCQTTGSSSQGRQNAITTASMVSDSADCSQIAQNIGVMDQIIVATGNTSYQSSYNTQQAVHSTLSHSNVSPYLSDLAYAWKGNSYGNTQLERQQNSNAQREKSRLVGLFQQKKCVRNN